MKRDLPYSFLTTLLKFAVNLYEQRESVRPTKMKHLSRGRFPEWSVHTEQYIISLLARVPLHPHCSEPPPPSLFIFPLRGKSSF